MNAWSLICTFVSAIMASYLDPFWTSLFVFRPDVIAAHTHTHAQSHVSVTWRVATIFTRCYTHTWNQISHLWAHAETRLSQPKFLLPSGNAVLNFFSHLAPRHCWPLKSRCDSLTRIESIRYSSPSNSGTSDAYFVRQNVFVILFPQ